MNWMCSRYGLHETNEEPDSSYKPPPAPPVLDSSAVNNPPNSTLPGAFQTLDTFSALPLQNKRPCAPSPSNSSPLSAQCHSQSPHLHNSASPEPQAASLPARDHPPSSTNPDARAPASDSGCVHPS